MALFGGFRPGELIALTWEDIDSKGNAVSISKSTSKTKEEMITKPLWIMGYREERTRRRV